MKTQLKSIDGTLIAESDTLTLCELAQENKTNLTRADLTCANLTDADLTDANLINANLRSANLRGTNLRGANIDFSAWPLWCGTKNVKVCKKIAAQLAMHFCWLDCDDEEIKTAQKALETLAKQCKHWKGN